MVRPSVHNARADSSDLVKGQQLFQANCSACHNFLQKGIGPDLARVTTQMPVEWLKAFIYNAPDMIAKGDARANWLYAEYKQMMPAFTNLKDADIDAILLYIKANQKKDAPKKQGPDGIENPIPIPIAASERVLDLEYYTTAPASATAAPLARINKMAVLPGGPAERVFVADLRGKLYELVDKEWRVALDIAQQKSNFTPVPGLATGFGSFAFHPEFYQNGLLYTSHTEKPKSGVADFAYADSIRVTLQWVVTEWQIKDPTSTAFLPARHRELIRIDMVSGIHGMQELAFNPTAPKKSPDYGMLYVGVGDGGASENGYPFLCNSKRTVWSSVLRIDPAPSAGNSFTVPADNPFAGQAAKEQTIWAYGLRNPQYLSWMRGGAGTFGRRRIARVKHSTASR